MAAAEKKLVCLYVIECADGTLYVGTTGNTAHALAKRMDQHKEGSGSEWTKEHGFKRPVEMKFDQLIDAEHRRTLELMKERGVEQVRGGKYTKRVLDDDDRDMIRRDMAFLFSECYKCGKTGHCASDCTFVVSKQQQQQQQQQQKDEDDGGAVKSKRDVICFNCQKPGHISTACKQKGPTCAKCNRRGHTAARCYARTRIDAVDEKRDPSLEIPTCKRCEGPHLMSECKSMRHSRTKQWIGKTRKQGGGGGEGATKINLTVEARRSERESSYKGPGTAQDCIIC
jgi:predicted GIY-YIG superfamily endonuclease